MIFFRATLSICFSSIVPHLMTNISSDSIDPCSLPLFVLHNAQNIGRAQLLFGHFLPIYQTISQLVNHYSLVYF
jgi:hypothetical protein